jgi:TetR/AcrR family transcriptional repressor of nem operon
MGRPTLAESKDTRAELIMVAMELIQTRGYNAFSYQDLADRLKIRKASIHYYFPTKEDLGVSLVEFVVEHIKASQRKTEAQETSALTRLESFFDIFASIAADGEKICLCGALSSEWGGLPPKLQDATRILFSTFCNWLKAILEKGRKAGEIAKNGTIEEQAQFVLASLQGALQTSRAQSNPVLFRSVTRQVLNSLKT